MKFINQYREEKLSRHLESILGDFPDGVIACDLEEKMIYLNAAADALFERPQKAVWQGASFQQFLLRYKMEKISQSTLCPMSWPLGLIMGEEAPPHPSETHFLCLLPSGRYITIRMVHSSLYNGQKHRVGTLFVLHDTTYFYEKAIYLQRVSKATSALIDAIAQVPYHLELTLPEETPLLSPAILLIAQQLVDVIRQILECQYVTLWAPGTATGHIYYVTGSGQATEQENYRREATGAVILSDFLNDAAIAPLYENQEVQISTEQMHHLAITPPDYSPGIFLAVPLFLTQQLGGILIVKKAGATSVYTLEEIALIKAVVAQAMLIIEGLHYLQAQSEKRNAAVLMHEIQRLSNDFLTLAAHELRTPLTTIKGNIQVAERRLKRFKPVASEQRQGITGYLEQIQQPLDSATEGARVQQRIINAIIDDARLQAGMFQLSTKDCDLLALLREAMAEHQQSAPTHPIVLDTLPIAQTVPIVADPERIKQVIDTYLENALASSPADQPVAVQLRVEENLVHVSVHDEGAGIPEKEQKLLWDRFYRGKGSAVQQELDLSLGLGFFLCKAFIEHHQGSVGVQSEPDHGTTFWFTLPLGAEEKPEW